MIACHRIVISFTALMFSTTAVSSNLAQEITAPPIELKTSKFYAKYVSADGYPIVASAGVNDFALREAAFLVNMLLAIRMRLRTF